MKAMRAQQALVDIFPFLSDAIGVGLGAACTLQNMLPREAAQHQLEAPTVLVCGGWYGVVDDAKNMALCKYQAHVLHTSFSAEELLENRRPDNRILSALQGHSISCSLAIWCAW